jgi:hypothetical protein
MVCKYCVTRSGVVQIDVKQTQLRVTLRVVNFVVERDGGVSVNMHNIAALTRTHRGRLLHPVGEWD